MAAGSIATVACGGTPEDAAGVESAREALVGENGFAANGFAANGFAANGFAANGLAANGFAANGFAANGFAANGFAANGFAVNGAIASALADANTRELFRYVVSCALPDGVALTATLDGQTEVFPGALGLEPGWLYGACDGSCQRWVSACVLARVNHLGQHVEISIRGDNRALKMQPHEEQEWTVREATYYGNLFLAKPAVYLCLSPGATSDARVCGPSLADCPMTVAGSCDDVCAGPGRNQTFRDCGPGPFARGSDALVAETVTVFLRP